jgi:hypothetical protein
MIKTMLDEEFKDIWAGQPGLVIGRGTNDYQRKEELDLFPGKVVGCNTAFNTRKCDVITLMDEKVFFHNRRIYKKLTQEGTILAVINPIYPLYNVDVHKIEASKPERCSTSFDTGFYPCRLTGYIALNIALLLGLNPIWMYGFNPSLSPNRQVLEERCLDFFLISEWCKKNNRQVYLVSDGIDNMMNMFFQQKRLPRRKRSYKKKTKN